MSHEASLELEEPRTSQRNREAAGGGLSSRLEREELREELLRRIVAREELRQHLRRMPR